MDKNKIAKYDKANRYMVVLIGRFDIVMAGSEEAVFDMYEGKPTICVKRI